MWVTQSHTFSPSLLLIRLYHMSQLSLYFLYYLQLSDELSYSDNSIMSFKPVVSLICYFFSRCSTSHEKYWLWVQSGAFSERWRWTGQLVVQCSIRYLHVVSWVRLLDITGIRDPCQMCISHCYNVSTFTKSVSGLSVLWWDMDVITKELFLNTMHNYDELQLTSGKSIQSFTWSPLFVFQWFSVWQFFHHTQLCMLWQHFL